MHVVVNHLPLQNTVDWTALVRTFGKFEAMIQGKHPGFRGITLIKAGEAGAGSALR